MHFSIRLASTIALLALAPVAAAETIKIDQGPTTYVELDTETGVMTITKWASERSTATPTTTSVNTGFSDDSFICMAHLWYEDDDQPNDVHQVLYLVGMEGTTAKLKWYEDTQHDGVLDDLKGTLDLGSFEPIAAHAVPNASISGNVLPDRLFLLEKGTSAVVRAKDSTGNGRYDSVETYAPVGGGVTLADANVLWHDYSQGFRLMTGGEGPYNFTTRPVRVYCDVDLDQTPDIASLTTMGLLLKRAPEMEKLRKFTVTNTEIAVHGCPHSVVELWKTGAGGEKEDPDPAVARFGFIQLDEHGLGELEISPPTGQQLVLDEHYRLFDMTNQKWQIGVMRAIAGFPRGQTVSPESIDPLEETTITVNGTDFTSTGMQVWLRHPVYSAMDFDLTPWLTYVSAKKVRVTLPALGMEWCGAARLEITGASTPNDIQPIEHAVVSFEFVE